MSLIQELQRRNVIRVGLAYAASSWLLIQLAEIIFEAWGLPEAGLQVLIIGLAIGLPLVLVLAWVFEWTPEGIRREAEVDRDASITRQTGRRLDRVIIVVLALALGYFAVDKFLLRAPANDGVETSDTAVEDTAPETVVTEAPTLPTDASVAVLPLRNLGQAGSDDAFAAGMHDGLLTSLAQIGALRVVARASVMRIAEQGLSPREVAELLQVATVLEGGVQRAGDQLRVSLQLVDPATDSYLWAETFDRQLTADNVFAVQNEIARAVTEALEAELTASDEQRLSQLPTDNLAALEAYFEGRAQLDRRTEAGIQASREAFQTAYGFDPGFAQAYASEGLAILLLIQSSRTYGNIPRAEALALATPLVERAASLAPDDAEVLAIQGLLANFALRYEESIRYLKRSLDINPANAEAITWLSITLPSVGELTPMPELSRQMVARDPSSALALVNASVNLTVYQQAEPGEVEGYLQRLDQLDPGRAFGARLAVSQAEGDLVGAVRNGLLSLEVNSGLTQVRDAVAVMLLRLGLLAEGRLMAANLPDSTLALASWDIARAVELSQREFAANPESQEAAIDLAYALGGAGQWEAVLNLAQAIWFATGKNPFSFPPEALVDVAWMARLQEQSQLFEEFSRAARTVIDKFEEATIADDRFEVARAKLALVDGDEVAAMRHLTRAIDLGFRVREVLRQPVWDDVRDNLDFLEQVERIDQLIAEERRAVIDMLCGPDALMTWREPAPETCVDA